MVIKLADETLIFHDGNKNWRFYTLVFTCNFSVLIMITAQLLAAFRPFNLNNSDSSDLNNYNFNNYRITHFFFVRASNFWLSLKCSFLWVNFGKASATPAPEIVFKIHLSIWSFKW